MMLRGSVEETNVPLFDLQKRTWYTSYQFQGKTQTTWRIIAGLVNTLTSRNKSPNISAHGILALELLGETQCSQALDETTLYLHREEIEQDQLQQWALVLWPAGIPRQPVQGSGPTCTLLLMQ